MRLGALEAGGTKMVCAIGDENGNIFVGIRDWFNGILEYLGF